MESVGLPTPEEREKDGYFASGMFNPDKRHITKSELNRPLTESQDGGTAGWEIPSSAADSEITGGDGAYSTDYSIQMMDARQKNKREAEEGSRIPRTSDERNLSLS